MFSVKEKLPLEDLAQLADEFLDTMPNEQHLVHPISDTGTRTPDIHTHPTG